MTQGRQTDTDPHHDSGILASFVGSLTTAAIQRPWRSLIYIALLSLLSLGITARFLTFKTDRSDLIDPQADFHQRWTTFLEKFGDDSDIVIVVEGENEAAIQPVMERIGSQLDKEKELFSRVLYKVDVEALSSKALQYLSPHDLEKAAARLEMYRPILNGHWDRAELESYAYRLASYITLCEQENAQEDLQGAISQASSFVTSLTGFFQSPGNFQSPWPEVVSSSSFPQTEELRLHYQITPNGKMGFILALPHKTASDFAGTSLPISRLQEIIETARVEFPANKIGMTGIPVLEADEMRQSQNDMTLASLLSTIGVGIILFVGFRGYRHPMMSMVMLGAAMAWCMGFTTLAIGHLNILSVSFAAMLIGLGSDFSIHYLARYVELRHEGEDLIPAIMKTSTSVGGSIIIAGIITALAFFSAIFTNFLGVAELGIIAGGGILICTLATFIVLPPLIAVADRKLEIKGLPTPFQFNGFRKMLRMYPISVCIGTVLLVIVLGIQAFEYKDGQFVSKVRYDYNLLNLQSKGLESVDLQKRIFDESNGSLLYAISMTDSAENTRLLKEKFLALPTVSRVEDLASYLPTYPPAETNLLVQSIHAQLSGLKEPGQSMSPVNPLGAGKALEALYNKLSEQKTPNAQIAAASLDQMLNQFEHLPLEHQTQLLTGYQQGLLMALQMQFKVLQSIADPTPITPSDFPDAFRSRFVSEAGDWLVRVYPAKEIWDEIPLTEFVHDVRTVDPEITGTPLQNYEAAGQIQRSYANVAIYALAMVMLVLLFDLLSFGPLLISLMAPLTVIAILSIVTGRSGAEPISPVWMVSIYSVLTMVVASIFDFRNTRILLLALLAPVGGVFLMFGILSLLNMHLNPANLIALPLIMGIGVDNGVHMIHDYRSQTGRYEASPSCMNAVIVTCLTSIMGFGSMILAAHQGLVSLGLVLLIGVSSCLFISLMLLPAIFTLLTRNRPLNDQNSSAGQGDEEASAHIVPLPTTQSAMDAA